MSLRFAFLLVLVPLLLVLSLRRPLWGLFSLMFMYYFRPDVWGKPGWWRPVEWLSIATFVSWMMRGKSIRIAPVFLVSVFLLFTMVICSERAIASKQTSYDTTLIILKLVFAQFIVIQTVRDMNTLRVFLWVNILANLWTLKSALVQTIAGGGARVDLGAGQGGGANYLAMVFVMGLPILYFRYLHGSKLERKIALMIAPLYVIAVVGTGSRGGFLALFFTMAFLSIRSGKKLAGFIVMLLLSAVFVIAIPQEKWERFTNTFSGEGKEAASKNSRLRLWAGGLKMFKKSPITGVGHDNYQILSPSIVGVFAGKNPIPYDSALEGRPGYEGFVAHSTWIQSLADSGLIGSIPFFSLFIMSFFTLYRVRRLKLPPDIEKQVRVSSQILEAILWAFIIGSSFASHFKLDFLWWYFGAVGALGLIADQKASEWRQFREAQLESIRQESVGPQPTQI
ncbi:MAG: O-antigen ligase family protein [Planctomycetota bacterium]